MTTANLHAAREAWLQAAITDLRPRFQEIGFLLPDRIHVSVGFPHCGVQGENSVILAVTYSREASHDGVNEIFVSPMLDDAPRVLDVLLHELVHVALNNEDGHKARFKECATALGLEGPMTATTASVVLAAEMVALAETLGEYPHKAMDSVLFSARRRVPAGAPGLPVPPTGPRISSGPKVQGTRQIKVVCDCCGYTLRTTRRWLDVGLPSCPAGTVMHEV